jgi:hypothetical protein
MIASYIFFINLKDHQTSKFGELLDNYKNLFLIPIALFIVFIFICKKLDLISCPIIDHTISRVNNLIGSNSDSNGESPWLLGTLIVIFYLLLRIYWSWIKDLWSFLKTDSIVRYLFCLLTPVIIMVTGYQYWFYAPGLSGNSSEYALTIDRLNGFYSTLFTAIAIIIGIAGLYAWKNIARLEKLKEIEKKVLFLWKKQGYADWIKEKFNGNEQYLGSSKLILNKDEEKEFDQIKNFLQSEYTGNSWLEIILGKRLADDKEYQKAHKIYHFIKQKDLLDPNSKIEAVLYHMIGQLYSDFYFNQNFDLNGERRMQKDMETLGDEDEKISVIDHLKIAERHYQRSLKVRKYLNIPDDETRGNLAVILIELYMNTDNKQEKEKYVDECIEHLEKIIKDNRGTYNTYYDLSRAEFIKNKNNKKTKRLLLKAVENISSIKQKDKFIDFIEKDNDLSRLDKWEELKKEIKDLIDKKRWLKQ